MHLTYATNKQTNATQNATVIVMTERTHVPGRPCYIFHLGSKAQITSPSASVDSSSGSPYGRCLPDKFDDEGLLLGQLNTHKNV